MADYLNIAGRIRTTASDGVALEAQEVKDLNLDKSQQEINTDVQTELGDRYTKEETYSKEQLNELITTPDVNYVSVVATDATTAVTDILPATGEADTIYRVGNWDGTQYDPTMYALYAWNGSAYVCLAVRSFVGEVYDVSVNHPDGQGNPTPYADIAAAIGTDGANIPADIRRGGMIIKYIQISDNNYVQYRLMTPSFSINTDDWSFCENDVLIYNPDFVKVYTDSANKILWAIKADGSVFYGNGCPQQVKDYIQSKIDELSLDEYADIVNFLDGIEEDDKTLSELLNEKVDSVEGKSLINADFASMQDFSDNTDYVQLVLDQENKIIYGIKKDGDFFFGAGVPKQIMDAIPGAVGTNIVTLNDSIYTDIALKNLKRQSRIGSTTQYTPFVLLHASDIHGDGTNLNRLIEYKSYWNSYIDDAIISGDIAKSYYEDGIDFYINNQDAHNIMLAIGNHDTAAKVDGQTVWDAHVGQDSYNRYIKDFYSEWGNVTVVQDKCYYYKDYTDYGIRMIVTDCMEGASSDQQQWFDNALANTPAGYSVICVCHFPYYPNVTDSNASPNIECSFDSRQIVTLGTNDHIPDTFISSVSNWLTANNNANAGRFICWLGGHAHVDKVCIAKDTTQLVISVDTAAHTSRNVSYSDIERIEGKKSQDLFNLVGIDTYQKIIKVMRVGADIDSWMRSKKTMCIQYASNDTYTLTNNTPELIYCS